MSEVAVQSRLAKIVHVIDSGSSYGPLEVVINRGAQQGVKKGDRFLVFGEGPEILDPESGESLGRLELVRGRGEVVHVQDNLATIRSIETQKAATTRRITHNASSGFAQLYANSIARAGKVIEEELTPEVAIPFDHVRLGDQAKPI